VGLNSGSAVFIARLSVFQSHVSELAMLWILKLRDGEQSLLDIAERSGCAFGEIQYAATLLFKQDLLKQSGAQSRQTSLGWMEG